MQPERVSFGYQRHYQPFPQQINTNGFNRIAIRPPSSAWTPHSGLFSAPAQPQQLSTLSWQPLNRYGEIGATLQGTIKPTMYFVPSSPNYSFRPTEQTRSVYMGPHYFQEAPPLISAPSRLVYFVPQTIASNCWII